MTSPMPRSASSPRLPYVPDPPADERVREAFDRLRRHWPGAPVLNLYRLLGWSPGLIGPWLAFAQALRFRTAVPPRLRELMIVRSGQLLDAPYEWQHHQVAALAEGVTPAQIDALAQWPSSCLFDAGERAVLALAEETALGPGASEATVRELQAHFTVEQVAELVIIAGFYAGVGRIVNSLDVPVEPGFESMLPRER